MKTALFTLLTLISLSGCNSHMGVHSSIPIGNGSIGTSSVDIDSHGNVYGNVGVGGYL